MDEPRGALELTSVWRWSQSPPYGSCVSSCRPYAIAYGLLWPMAYGLWPTQYDAPCGGNGRYARPAVPWPMMRRVAVAGATRALRC
eukprot:1282020-Prymnesium_polylepis.1